MKNQKNLNIPWLGVGSNHRHETVQAPALPKPRRVTELPQPYSKNKIKFEYRVSFITYKFQTLYKSKNFF